MIPASSAGLERLLLETERFAKMGSWSMDLASGAFEWSDGLYRLLDYEPGGIEPTVNAVLDRVHPDDLDWFVEYFGTITDDPSKVPDAGVSAEYRVVLKSGLVHHVRFQAWVARNDADVPVRWVGTIRDVTEQRLVERELRTHDAVGEGLRGWHIGDEGPVGLLRRVATALDSPVASLWIADADQRLRAAAYWSAPEVSARRFEAQTRAASYSLGEGIAGDALASGEPVVATDLDQVLGAERGATARVLGIRSVIAFPALGKHRPVAVLAVYTRDRREPAESLLRTLATVGEAIGRFVNQTRLDPPARQLTAREIEVLELSAAGLRGPAIAERLYVSPTTVKTHFEHIYEKLGVSDRAAAVAYAFRTGVIS